MRDILVKIFDGVKRYEIDIILAIGVVLVSLLSFAVGYLTAKEQLKQPIRVEQMEEYGTTK